LRIDFGAEVKIREGSKGAFEVLVDGRLIHSKLETGLMPKTEALVEMLRGN
jgi:selT/selW/selH-like putative selenoprotein